MKAILTTLVAIVPATLFALPNYDPLADATASSGTAYALANWVSKSDAGTAGTGQKDATGGQWYHAGVAGNNSPTIESGNVSYPGLAGGLGNKVLVGSAGANLAAGRYAPPGMDLGMQTPGFRYYSFVLKASDITALSTVGGAGVWIAGFNNTPANSTATFPTTIGGRTLLKAVVGGFQVGLSKAAEASPPFHTGQTFTTSDSVFVVVSYETKSGTTSDDVVSMWINPNPSTFANNANKPAATLTTGAGATDLSGGVLASSIRSFLLGNTANTGLHHVDELRVATDWAGVTPSFFTTQPTNVTKDYGQTAVFNVGTASSATYQWQKNGADLSGETAAALSLPNVTQTNEASYAVVVTGPGGAITSSVVTLTVNDPVITSGPTPASQSLAPGDTAIISAGVLGSPTLSYQWKKDGGDVTDGTFGSAVISGANTATLTITGVRAGGLGDGGSYTLAVTNGLGRGTISSASTLTVINPAFTTQPSSQTKNFNESVTFNVTVSGTAPPFSYIWRKNGTPVTVDGIHIVQNDAGTASSLTINNLTAADQASAPGYTVVVVDNALQSTVSSVATLTVIDPIITNGVANVITNAGANARFRVQATGSGSVTYVWKTNGVAVANGATPWGSTISGATSDTLIIANVATNDAKAYVVEVNGVGAMQSSTGTLSVVQITRQPTPTTLVIVTNTRAVFLAAATVVGPGSLTYQWRKTAGDVSGATATNLTINNAQLADSDSYYVRVAYGPGTSFIDSSTAALTVSSTPFGLYPTNLIVARVGDGGQTLRDAGNSIYLEQRTTSGSYLNTVTIPDTGTNSIIARGTAGDTIGGLNGMTTLTLSDDGRYLVVNGYRTNYDTGSTIVLGGGSVQDLEIQRAVCTLDSASGYLVRITGQPAGVYRCGAFDGVDEFWGATSAGTGGAYYFGSQVAAGAVSATGNVRIVSRFNGLLYFLSANTGLYHFAAPKPHPGDVETPDIALNNAGGAGNCDFAISADGNTAYIADGRAWSALVTNTTGGIQVWEKSGGVFGTIPTRVLRPDPGSTVGALYMTADFSGANPVIYATTVGSPIGSPNKIVRIVDDGSNSGAGTSAVIAQAGPGQQFRGIRFGPSDTVPRPTLAHTVYGSNLVLSWSGAFTLMSSTNAAGPYFDVTPAATSPHTNNMASPAQLYFGLRQN